jgi:hypothetical protein
MEANYRALTQLSGAGCCNHKGWRRTPDAYVAAAQLRPAGQQWRVNYRPRQKDTIGSLRRREEMPRDRNIPLRLAHAAI